ncbi:MAG: FG-GAP repeat domain-containing protein, partial [Flavobacteriales bacterium]
DGLADLIRYELFWTDLEVKFQILEGTFGEATVLPIEYWGGDFNFTFFDVDQNGSLDIVASRLSNPICEVFLNNSGFSELDHIFYDVPILDPITVAMGDVNNDGYLDMMTCDESSTYVRWGGTDLLLGDAIQINGTGGASRIQLVDLDLDGDLDFIGYTTTGIAYQLINDESTNWPMSVIDLSTGSNEVEFCLADFNGDGFPDLAHAEPTNFQVELRYNNQEGGFLPPEIPFAGYTPSHVSAADLNGDGSQDLVIGVIDQVTGILGLMNTSLSGCTDPLACNFNSEATVDGGDCCYDCGCTDPNALNYNSMATCADGSCEYQISISVFDDLDLNAQMNGPEYMLHDILVHVEPAGVDFITDLNGNFTLVALEGESFTLEVETTPVFPFHTTTDPFAVLVDESTAADGVLLGIAKLEPIPEVSIELWAPGLSGLCSAPENFVFLIQNQGNSVLNGTAVVEYSGLFGGLSVDFEHEVLNASTFQIEFSDLLPGAVILDNFSLMTPDAEFLGTFLD